MMGKIPNAANRGMRYFRDSPAAAAATEATIVITEVGVDDAECRDLTLGQAARGIRRHFLDHWLDGWVTALANELAALIKALLAAMTFLARQMDLGGKRG